MDFVVRTFRGHVAFNNQVWKDNGFTTRDVGSKEMYRILKDGDEVATVKHGAHLSLMCVQNKKYAKKLCEILECTHLYEPFTLPIIRRKDTDSVTGIECGDDLYVDCPETEEEIHVGHCVNCEYCHTICIQDNEVLCWYDTGK